MMRNDGDIPQDDHRRAQREPVTFPRLELPLPPFPAPAAPAATAPAAPAPAPAPATNIRDLPVGGFDEPVATERAWQSPFPAPAQPQGYTFQVVPPPNMSPVQPEPALAPTKPTLAEVPAASDPASLVEPSKLVLVLMAVTAAVMVWASGMAFSAALFAFGGLLASEIAIALAATRLPGTAIPTSARAVAVIAAVIALVATKKLIGQFGDMAFVAGLFVLVTVVPSMIILGAAAFILRRRASSLEAPGDAALRSGTLVRFGLLAAIAIAGYQAFKTFSAVPDAVVALVVVALAAMNVVAALRGTGRAAAS